MQGKVTEGADLLLTVREVAVRLRASAATVYALCASGKLPHVRISTNGIRVLASDLAAYVRASRAGS